jgi:AraC-like DNA-binding protein
MSGRPLIVPAAQTSSSITPRITALLSDATSVGRLRAAFGTECRFFDAQPELVAGSRLASVELVIVSPRDRKSSPLTTTVAAIHASRRSPPVYVYGDRSVECLRELMPLARSGACGVIVAGVDDGIIGLRRLLARDTLASAADVVTQAVHQVVSSRHLPLLLYCLEHITDPPTASGFAHQLKVSRRTLTTWAAMTGGGGVRALTSRCRVLVAIELLRTAGRSIEHVAHELRFSSSAHLHNTIRRYTGLRPRGAVTIETADWCRRFFAIPGTAHRSAGAGVASSGNVAARRGMVPRT